MAEAGLKVPDAAKTLQVTERTIYAWISGHAAVPYAAYRLLRIMNRFELPGWDGWCMHSGKLWTPEGYGLAPEDLAWWGLLVRKAAQFGVLYDECHRLKIRIGELLLQLQEAEKTSAIAVADGGTTAAAAVAPASWFPVDVLKVPDPGFRSEVLVTPQIPANFGKKPSGKTLVGALQGGAR